MHKQQSAQLCHFGRNQFMLAVDKTVIGPSSVLAHNLSLTQASKFLHFIADWFVYKLTKRIFGTVT